MRAIFMVDNEDIHTGVHRFRFLEIESITAALTFLPYALIALLTALGIIALIFWLDVHFGAIVLGGFGIFLLVLVAVLALSYQEIASKDEEKSQLTR
jgi:predicted lysophospholipase L1 biosynthesis ABC-type transport system permease subunit